MQSIEPAKPAENKAILLAKKISFVIAFIALGAFGTFMLEILRSAAGVYCMAFPLAYIWKATDRSQFVAIATINILGIIYISFFSILNYYFVKKTSEVARSWQMIAARALASGGSLPLLAFFALLVWSLHLQLAIAYILLTPVLCIFSQWFAVYKIQKQQTTGAAPTQKDIGIAANGNLAALESNLDQLGNAASSEQMNLLARSSLESYGIKIAPDEDKDMVPVLLDVLLKHKRFEQAEIVSRKHLELRDDTFSA